MGVGPYKTSELPEPERRTAAGLETREELLVAVMPLQLDQAAGPLVLDDRPDHLHPVEPAVAVLPLPVNREQPAERLQRLPGQILVEIDVALGALAETTVGPPDAHVLGDVLGKLNLHEVGLGRDRHGSGSCKWWFVLPPHTRAARNFLNLIPNLQKTLPTPLITVEAQTLLAGGRPVPSGLALLG